MADSPRILLLTDVTPAEGFILAVENLGLKAVVGGRIRGAALTLRLDDRDTVLDVIEYAQRHPLAAIISLESAGVSIACRAASMLAIPTHPPKAADFCDDLSWREKVPLIPTADPGEEDFYYTTLRPSTGKGIALASTHKGERAAVDTQLASQLGKAEADLQRVAGFKNGPLHMRFRPNPFALTGVSIAAVATHTDALRFYVPLVSEELSWEDAVVRCALGFDLARLYRR